jgi:hypothetical protein
MILLDALAEKRIREAIEQGEFEDLPGAGKPLALDDDALVPEELRAAYRLLKNAGFVPPELENRREIRELEQLLAAATGPDERSRIVNRLSFLLARCGRRHLALEQDYFEKMTERLAAKRG